MSARTLQEMAAAVQRKTGALVPMGEIIDAINNANKELHVKYEWPWTYAESTFAIAPLYNAGTISVTDGSNQVNLAGAATWDTNWLYKRLYLGVNNVSYEVESFPNPTTALLKVNVNLGTSIVNGPYTLFQDTYALPSDCEFGNILLIVNPKLRYRLRDLPKYTLTWQNLWPGVFASNFQFAYCTSGYDDATGAELIQFAPPAGQACEFVMIYRRRPPELNTPTATSLIPESFDRILELLAEYEVKRSRPNVIPGWMEAKQEAYQLMQNMRRRMSNQMLDNFSNWAGYPFLLNESSIGSNGLFISGPTVGSYP